MFQPMWTKAILIIVLLIPFTEEKCDKMAKNIYPLRSFVTKVYSYLSCTDITPYDDLNTDILSNMDGVIEDVIITNSSIPELNESMFRNVSFKDLTIRANVEIVQSKAFENCNITSLILDYNDIKLLKDAGFSSPSIQLLSIEGNKLSEIKNNNFLGLSGLRNLNLKHNNITTIEEDSFSTLINLNELNLSFNQLTELPFGLLRSVTQLQTIFLNNNLLKAVSDHFFSSCKILKYLNIENNYMTVIDARYYPKSLLSINASSNQLMSIDFSNLQNAETIDLSCNKVTTIIGWFYNLPALKYLYINNNALGPFIDTKTFHNLQNLTVVDLEGNGLQNFAFESFDKLPYMRVVSLANNNLTYVDFSNCHAHLFTLNLRKNFLNEVRNLSKLQDLNKLDLSDNKLQEIRYNTFENMVNLSQLLLQYNDIYALHMGCFKDLVKLKELNLGHNKIMNIEIGAFTGLNVLITLDISYNNLTNLDENIFYNTKHLSNLNIAYNNLSSVEIRKIQMHSSWLRKITLTGNVWNCKYLADFYRRNYFLLVNGTSYNVTNVFGIPCVTTDSDKLYNKTNTTNFTLYLSSVEQQATQISYKMTVNNVVLIALLILLLVKFHSVKCCSCYNAAMQFVYKRYRNEQDMQLI